MNEKWHLNIFCSVTSQERSCYVTGTYEKFQVPFSRFLKYTNIRLLWCILIGALA